MSHRIIRVLIGVVIIAAVVGGVVYWEWPGVPRLTTEPPLAEAVPTISWVPTSVTQTIGPGESKTIAVSFVASEAVSNVVVRVVPELQPFVRVSPSAFASIARGQAIGVNVTFSAPPDASIARLDGTVQLRSAIDARRAFSRPFPIVLHIGRVFVDPVAGYEITYDSTFVVSDLQSTRPAFVAGKLFSIPGDMPNLSVAIYENPLGLPVENWYATTLANREYAFPDAGGRTITHPVVAGVLSLQVRSEVLGYVQLRTFVPHGDKVFGVETTVPDDASVPESYFLMLSTFSLTR